jgi:tRNA(fMet)-specific endonuclease VapC
LPDWLVDTNIVSALMRQDPRVTVALAQLSPADTLYLSVITHGEIGYGIQRVQAGRRRNALDQAYKLLLPRVGPLLEVTRPVSDAYSSTKGSLERWGIVLPENDLWIAATALVHGLTLVTDDHHFAAIPGLTVENWLRGHP